jgi:hypothetical protein
LAFHSGREADHSPPSSAEVKEWVELYLPSPNTHSWRGAQLGGAQGKLYLFTFINYIAFLICHVHVFLLCDELHFRNIRLQSTWEWIKHNVNVSKPLTQHSSD